MEPFRPDIGILGLVPDNWNGLWQVRHSVLSKLARHFHVVWINPAHERQGILSSLRNREREIAPQAPANFEVYSAPFWCPKVYRPNWLSRATLSIRLNQARNLLIRKGCRYIVLYVWRPEFDAAMDLVSYDLACYHIDDEYSFADGEPEVDLREAKLLESVGQVFIHSRGLFERKGNVNPNSVLIPNGVEFKTYSKKTAEPPDLTGINRPRVGYIGALKRTLDWALIEYLLRNHEDWAFVFVGPERPGLDIRERVAQLAKYKNAYFLGGKPPAELPSYTQHLDVCIMPYREDSHMMRFGYPLKLHEYLAAGRPIVATPIYSLLEFAKVVSLPKTHAEWSKSIELALEPEASSPANYQARIDIARQYDWEILSDRIAKEIVARVNEKCVHL